MESKKALKQQVIQTLAYADLFDYPMRESEIAKWFVGRSDHLNLSKINGVVFRKNGFFFLKDRDYLPQIRKRRQRQAKVKFEQAKKIARLIGFIPTVKLIGVSGSLAMKNTDRGDDIDLFIITANKTLWLTRLLSVIILELKGNRRRPNDAQVKDKMCLNMFIDEQHLSIPKSLQNLYTAHEVTQLFPLLDREGTHHKFLYENRWVKEYLPNAMPRVKGEGERKKQKGFLYPIPYTLYPIELIAKSLQLFYMKIRGRLPCATIMEGRLFFYPKNFHKQILKSYKTRLNKYGVSF